MYTHFFSFLFSIILGLIFPTTAIAQENQSACISTHFYQFYGPSDSVKVVSIERLQRWSTWCKYGYDAPTLDKEVRPCYEKAVQTIREQSEGYVMIGVQQTQELKEQCRQQLWFERISPLEQ